MNKYLFLVQLFFTLSVFGQISYDFSIPLPPSNPRVTEVNSIYFGTYKNANSLVTYEFSEEGLFLITTNITFVTRQTIRESSKYEIRNNHIFGVHAEDSIPCILEGDQYYFGIKNRDLVIGKGSKNVLTQQTVSSYILNFEENGTFVPMFLTFENSGLSIAQFDYEWDTKLFKKIDERTSVKKDIELVTLTPSAEEWKKMKLNEMKSEVVVFSKE
jgi:hypothetical protein